MGALSKFLLVAFEISNELYVAVGAGVFGIVILLKHGFESHQCLKTLSVITLTTCSLIYINSEKQKIQASKKKVVCITGCDSGLGYSLSQHAVDMGFTVVAGFLSLESKGSKQIRKVYGSNIIQIQIDVTDSSSVQSAVQTLEHFFSRNQGYSLHAVINNAGVMVFGEFEWLTEKLIQQQLDVNLLGTFKFTNALCPLLRQYKGRLLTITSHCSQTTLPGLAVYGATKAALTAWSDGLRIEMSKYGVSVLTFIPGSFTLQSNIMARQLQNVQEMHDSFTPEQHNFYSDYFKRYNVYLSFITPPPTPVKIEDESLYVQFENALLDKYPNVVYKNESLRYRIYHVLFKWSPICVRDYFVTKFMQMPEYVPAQSKDIYDDIEDIDE
ncbi:unnamed protein product [Phaedon cochleariae]|uniref:Uncharacterized protein n=1 Tax=Phaedon cochleariae TaxID=80249 RepID=A0A9P0DPZ5_PHACE|nr:unnamed protein product [Phaedon cochleariae]